MSFDDIHKFTAKWEGALSDEKEDKGGLTHWGVSISFLTGFAKSESGKVFLSGIGVATPITKTVIRRLTKEQAKAILKNEFWDKPRLYQMPTPCAWFCYDTGVLFGSARAIRMLQQAINDYASKPISADGVIGPKTQAAASACDMRKVISRAIRIRKGKHQAKCDEEPDQKKFLGGWVNRCTALENFIMERIS